MSQDVESPILVPTGERLSWSQVWFRAITRPTVKNFEQIINDPNISTRRAYIWIFVSSLISFAIAILVQMLFPAQPTITPRGVTYTAPLIGLDVILFICGAPIVGAVSILILVINSAITQGIAGALGGKGNFTKLVYTSSAFAAPMTLVMGVLNLIPFVNLLIYPLGLYNIVLSIIAVKAVNQFGWGKALASSIVIYATVLVLVSCVMIFILTLFGPVIGNVFSDIIQQLGTPVP
jgi:hypothetical protein